MTIPNEIEDDEGDSNSYNAVVYISIIATCSILLGIIVGVLCWCKCSHKNKDSDSDVESTHSNDSDENRLVKPTNGNHNSAIGAQMYHYKSKKQQIISCEKTDYNTFDNGVQEDLDKSGSEEDTTIYECPGLVTSGTFEVRNPLFKDE